MGAEQIHAASQAKDLVIGMMQEYVLPHLIALDKSPSHESGPAIREVKRRLSEAMLLGGICAEHINDRGWKYVNKSTILRKFQSRHGRSRGEGLER